MTNETAKTKTSILAIDDGEENRLILEELIQSLGHDVLLAENGAIGYEKACADKPEIILLDLQMPEMDGYQCLEALKKEKTTKDIPVIIITSVDEMDSVVKCLQLGAEDYLPKPFEPEILKARIHNSMKKYFFLKKEKDLLEKTLGGSIKTMLELTAIANPKVFGKAMRLRRLTQRLCAYLKLNDSWSIEIASMFSMLGAISLSEDIIQKILEGRPLLGEEKTQFDSQMQLSEKLIRNIPRMESVANILKYQNKNYDGSGEPKDGVFGMKLPIGARLLKIVLDYDSLMAQQVNILEIISRLKSRKGSYDPPILEALENVILNENEREVRALKVKELKVGMLLAEDVTTEKDNHIASRGQEISLPIIERIRNIHQKMKINEPIRVILPKTI